MNIDQLEAVARAATPGEWTYDRGLVPPDGPQSYSTISADDTSIAEVNDLIPNGLANAAHIAAFDPPTVLALIAVARAAIDVRDVSGLRAEFMQDELSALSAALSNLGKPE